MRALIIATCTLLVTTGCDDTTLEDYCGDPAVEAASWDDGSEATAAELRDGLLGLWEGSADFGGTLEPMTLVINEPTDDPALITYPDAGENSGNMEVADACLDTLRVSMPTAFILDDLGVDIDTGLDFTESAFSGGWGTSQEIEIPGCTEQPCAYQLSFSRYDPDSDEIVGKLARVSTIEDDDSSAEPFTDANISLFRMTE